MVILLTFHRQFCDAAAVTDRDRVRGGKDMIVAQAAGQTIASSKMSLYQYASVTHTNKRINALLGVESELVIGIPRGREQE